MVTSVEKQSSTSFSVLSSKEEWILTEVIDSKHRKRKKKLLRGEKSYNKYIKLNAIKTCPFCALTLICIETIFIHI